MVRDFSVVQTCFTVMVCVMVRHGSSWFTVMVKSQMENSITGSVMVRHGSMVHHHGSMVRHGFVNVMVRHMVHCHGSSWFVMVHCHGFIMVPILQKKVM